MLMNCSRKQTNEELKIVYKTWQQKHSVKHVFSSLETARLLANAPIVTGAEWEFPGNCSVSYLSLAMIALEESVGGA